MINRFVPAILLTLTLTLPSGLVSQAVPAGATAHCKDGTYSTAHTQQGACSRHGGIAEWLAGATADESASPAKETAPAPTRSAASTKAKAAPSGATALCKDGTYSTAHTQRGACSRHGGIDEWLATTDKSSSATEEAAPSGAGAATPAKAEAAPSGATAQCKDGSYSTAHTQQGACSRHGGIAEWLAGANADESAPGQEEVVPKPSAKTTTPAPTNAPADATALCADGTYSHAQHHRGACSYHGGVKQWLKDVPS